MRVEGEYRIIKGHGWKTWRITGNPSVYRFDIGKYGYVFITNFETTKERHRNEQEYLLNPFMIKANFNNGIRHGVRVLNTIVIRVFP